MTTNEMPDMPEAPETAAPAGDPEADDLALAEPDGTTDPETTAHEDLDLETLAHADDADQEALAGHLAEGRLDGQEDGRLLD